MKRSRLNLPACIAASAAGISRAAESMSAIVCSAAETILLVGTLHTGMPCSLAASTSMLSHVTPARPIILQFVVTLVLCNSGATTYTSINCPNARAASLRT